MKEDKIYLQSTCHVSDCEVRDELKKQKEKHEALKTEFDHLRLEHDEMVEILKKEIPEDESQKKVQELFVNLTAKDSQLARLREQAVEAFDQAEDLRAKIEEKEVAINQLRLQHREFKSQYEMNDDIKAARAQLVELGKQMIEREERLKVLNLDLKNKLRLKAEVEETHDFMVDKIEAMQKTIKELLKQRKEATKALKDSGKWMDRKLAKISVPAAPKARRIWSITWRIMVVIVGMAAVAVLLFVKVV